MNIFEKLDRHTALVNRMAETVGADLGESLLAGRLSGPALRGMVLTCCCCKGAEVCPGWMAEHATGAEAAPAYCLNRDSLAALKG